MSSGAKRGKKQPHTLFVYGTLKMGFPNHRFLDDGKFLGAAKTVEPYALYMYEHPLVYADEAVCPIQGEVYTISNATLEKLDHLQNHPTHYYRSEIEVELESGKRMAAWIYMFPKNEGELISDGIFDMARMLV